jgi:alkylation response protein AidB-like acyl-CoA dehydrogenase
MEKAGHEPEGAGEYSLERTGRSTHGKKCRGRVAPVFPRQGPVSMTHDLFTTGDHPDERALRVICARLSDLSHGSRTDGPWASGSFQALAAAGCLLPFLPVSYGGRAVSEAGVLRMFTAVAEACLTTALALTQWASGCRLLARGPSELQARLFPAIGRGEAFTTVGISQLTTSRQHLTTPIMSACQQEGVWRLTGICPWVTGADSVQTIVTGSLTDRGEPMFFVVPTSAVGVAIDPPMEMLALSGSRTSAVRFTNAPACGVIDPPVASGPRAGGLATTALAVGAARGSIRLLEREAESRPGLKAIANPLAAEADDLADAIEQAAVDSCEADSLAVLRARGTRLVTRAGQAALTACKGGGFLAGHPAERLVREAMFFLVWSCPQGVADSLLCDLAAV